MPKKLAFLAALLLLTGCSAAHDTTTAENVSTAQYALEDSVQPFSAEDVPVPAQETMADLETTSDVGSDAQYFVFTRENFSCTDDSGLTVLYEQFCNSTFSASDADVDAWVDDILVSIRSDFNASSSNLLKYAQEFIELNGTQSFYSYSNYQELGIARHDDRVVSLLSLSSLYSGGAHPSSVQTAYNLDMANLTVLRLEDIIYPDSVETLADMVYEAVTEKFSPLGEGALFDDYPETIATSMDYGNMTPYWYFNSDGLVIFYNQYELGPYAAGIIKVELPYDRLDGILLDEYFPQTAATGLGDLFLKHVHTDGETIPISIEADGETILIGIQGQVFQVQLSEIFWLEETPILKEMIFSANGLDENDVLEITADFASDSSSFAIEFIDGKGEQKIYYIHTNSLSPTP